MGAKKKSSGKRKSTKAKVDKKDKKKATSTQESSDKFSATGIVVTILIMLALVMGVYYLTQLTAPSPTTEGEVRIYNGYTFVKSQGLWQVNLNTAQGEIMYQFRYHPSDLEDILFDAQVNGALIDVQRNKGTFATTGDEAFLQEGMTGSYIVASYNILRITSGVFGLPIEYGFTVESEEDIQVLTCSNASENRYVAFLRFGNETSIVQEGYCGIFTAQTSADLFMLTDLFVFKTLGVM